jgi:hypothetical protein
MKNRDVLMDGRFVAWACRNFECGREGAGVAANVSQEPFVVDRYLMKT